MWRLYEACFFIGSYRLLNFWCLSCVATLLHRQISTKEVILSLEYPTCRHVIFFLHRVIVATPIPCHFSLGFFRAGDTNSWRENYSLFSYSSCNFCCCCCCCLLETILANQLYTSLIYKQFLLNQWGIRNLQITCLRRKNENPKVFRHLDKDCDWKIVCTQTMC